MGNNTRPCSQCKEVKPLDKRNFRVNRISKDGTVSYRTECNGCQDVKVQVASFMRAMKSKSFLQQLYKRLREDREEDLSLERKVKVFRDMADYLSRGVEEKGEPRRSPAPTPRPPQVQPPRPPTHTQSNNSDSVLHNMLKKMK